ncbi:hypothetical protein CI238_11290 [Colletotrichum incanum]|uniref:Uncharacterized protein n=1 Tax=Colletotrichum incanum TaxID=1573173 RepID=A0A161Y9P0_COLIC|nr:hypothetical protein CI238_11290 [Colletotrichum incanum]
MEGQKHHPDGYFLIQCIRDPEALGLADAQTTKTPRKRNTQPDYTIANINSDAGTGSRDQAEGKTRSRTNPPGSLGRSWNIPAQNSATAYATYTDGHLTNYHVPHLDLTQVEIILARCSPHARANNNPRDDLGKTHKQRSAGIIALCNSEPASDPDLGPIHLQSRLSSTLQKSHPGRIPRGGIIPSAHCTSTAPLVRDLSSTSTPGVHFLLLFFRTALPLHHPGLLTQSHIVIKPHATASSATGFYTWRSGSVPSRTIFLPFFPLVSATCVTHLISDWCKRQPPASNRLHVPFWCSRITQRYVVSSQAPSTSFDVSKPKKVEVPELQRPTATADLRRHDSTPTPTQEKHTHHLDPLLDPPFFHRQRDEEELPCTSSSPSSSSTTTTTTTAIGFLLLVQRQASGASRAKAFSPLERNNSRRAPTHCYPSPIFSLLLNPKLSCRIPANPPLCSEPLHDPLSLSLEPASSTGVLSYSTFQTPAQPSPEAPTPAPPLPLPLTHTTTPRLPDTAFPSGRSKNESTPLLPPPSKTRQLPRLTSHLLCSSSKPGSHHFYIPPHIVRQTDRPTEYPLPRLSASHSRLAPIPDAALLT